MPLDVECPENFYNRKHELAIADLFVAYYPHITHWDTKWGVYEIERLNIPMFKVFYDARMVLNGNVILWEVDNGTEDLAKQVSPKVDKYIALSNAYPSLRFTVIFTMSKYRRMNLSKRSHDLLEALASVKRGNQFLVAKHGELVADPFGKTLVSPLDPMVKNDILTLTGV